MPARAGGTSGRRRGLAALLGAVWAAATLADGGADSAPITDVQLDDLLESASRSEQAATRRYAEADLAPYFSSGANARARVLFYRGRLHEARALLRGDEPPVRYLRALAALDSDPSAAASELRALAADYPALRDHCLFLVAFASGLRATELAEAGSLLSRSRLLTLTGAGGIGSVAFDRRTALVVPERDAHSPIEQR